MNRTSARIVILLIIVAIGAVLIARFLLHRPPVVARQTYPPSVSPGPPISGGPTTSPAKTGVIYVVSASGGDDNDLAPVTVTWADPHSPAREALNALVKSNNSPLPHGTSLRGVKIVNGLATADFTRDFQTNFHGSDTEEAQAINSILRTLGQFPDIDRVQILVEGKPIDALSQLPISGPLDVIRPDPVRQAKNAAGHR